MHGKFFSAPPLSEVQTFCISPPPQVFVNGILLDILSLNSSKQKEKKKQANKRNKQNFAQIMCSSHFFQIHEILILFFFIHENLQMWQVPHS